jgi:ABC-2 type transport system ATP-binding protein
MIEARDLTKRYGPTVAVDALSFDVRAGSVTGFLPQSPGRAGRQQRDSAGQGRRGARQVGLASAAERRAGKFFLGVGGTSGAVEYRGSTAKEATS